MIVPPGVSSSWGSWDVLPLPVKFQEFCFFSVDGLQDLWEQGKLGSKLSSEYCSDLHWNYAADWGSALVKCLVSFPPGNVWEKSGKAALISQFTGVTLNLSLYDPSFCIHFLNKGIGIKLDPPLFEGGSFNDCYLSSAGLWPLNKKNLFYSSFISNEYLM